MLVLDIPHHPHGLLLVNLLIFFKLAGAITFTLPCFAVCVGQNDLILVWYKIASPCFDILDYIRKIEANEKFHHRVGILKLVAAILIVRGFLRKYVFVWLKLFCFVPSFFLFFLQEFLVRLNFCAVLLVDYKLLAAICAKLLLPLNNAVSTDPLRERVHDLKKLVPLKHIDLWNQLLILGEQYQEFPGVEWELELHILCFLFLVLERDLLIHLNRDFF